jgi:hypothetical protein
MLGAATTGMVVTRDATGIALVTNTLTTPKMVHWDQDASQGFDASPAFYVRQTRADGFDASYGVGPAPVGNLAFGVRNFAREATPYRWPWYVSDDGSMAMGQAFTISQMRRTNGSIIGCYGPGSLDVRPDGNWSCIRCENSMHDPVSPNPNAYCIGFLNRDSGDARDAANNGPYSVASGLLQCAIGPSGSTGGAPRSSRTPKPIGWRSCGSTPARIT